MTTKSNKVRAEANNEFTIREWWDQVGTENAMKVGRAAGTTERYMRALRYRNKRPSYDLAQKLIQMAEKHTPGFAPDLTLMMAPLSKVKAEYSATIQPSAAFLKSVAKAKAAKALSK